MLRRIITKGTFGQGVAAGVTLEVLEPDGRAKLGGEFDAEADFFVFAKGTEADAPSVFSFNDSEVV